MTAERVFHVNMLRAFQAHRATESNYYTDSVVESDKDIPFWKDGAPDDQPMISDQLNTEQEKQLRQFLSLIRYSKINQVRHNWQNIR